jgi:peptide-methionine (S)-S-oxide reductase
LRHTATLGAGCFWGVESTFRKLDGVTATAVGYSGGKSTDPTYEDVCSGTTGHAEVVQVEFDDAKISFAQVLETFWSCHNPTTMNRQGPDVGSQYRSVIFYHDEMQKTVAEKSRGDIDRSGAHQQPVVTEIVVYDKFHLAEDYHQQYLEKRGLGQCGI